MKFYKDWLNDNTEFYSGANEQWAYCPTNINNIPNNYDQIDLSSEDPILGLKAKQGNNTLVPDSVCLPKDGIISSSLNTINCSEAGALNQYCGSFTTVNQCNNVSNNYSSTSGSGSISNPCQFMQNTTLANMSNETKSHYVLDKVTNLSNSTTIPTDPSNQDTNGTYLALAAGVLLLTVGVVGACWNHKTFVDDQHQQIVNRLSPLAAEAAEVADFQQSILADKLQPLINSWEAAGEQIGVYPDGRFTDISITIEDYNRERETARLVMIAERREAGQGNGD